MYCVPFGSYVPIENEMPNFGKVAVEEYHTKPHRQPGLIYVYTSDCGWVAEKEHHFFYTREAALHAFKRRWMSSNMHDKHSPQVVSV